MLYLWKGFYDKRWKRVPAEADRFTIPDYYISGHLPLDTEVHQGTKKIPVIEVICKFLHNRSDAEDIDREIHGIPQLFFAAKTDHLPFCPFISSWQNRTGIGQLPFILIKNRKLRHSHEIREYILSVLIASVSQFFQPFEFIHHSDLCFISLYSNSKISPFCA